MGVLVSQAAYVALGLWRDDLAVASELLERSVSAIIAPREAQMAASLAIAARAYAMALDAVLVHRCPAKVRWPGIQVSRELPRGMDDQQSAAFVLTAAVMLRPGLAVDFGCPPLGLAPFGPGSLGVVKMQLEYYIGHDSYLTWSERPYLDLPADSGLSSVLSRMAAATADRDNSFRGALELAVDVGATML